jgi:hypothetical protein
MKRNLALCFAVALGFVEGAIFHPWPYCLFLSAQAHYV